MKATRAATGITFTVDDVVPATMPLEEIRANEAVQLMIGGEIESCCDYHTMLVKDVHYQPLLAAVHLAFAQHRPLVLSPDAIWITIAQGIAHHMAIHGERLRKRFVSHEGKLELVFKAEGWIPRIIENEWEKAFESWSGQIREHVGAELHDALLCDFGTSTALERSVSQVIMMDIFERYFHYVAACICGIPSITLEGEVADWQRLREKVRALRIFDIDWWLDHLEPICDEFVAASAGDIALEHWRSICKLRNEYGGDVINGWIAKLFPYLREFPHGPCSRRNWIFENGKGFSSLSAPLGLSRVPFTWRDEKTRTERPMEAIAGFIGVTQDINTMALRPKVGWAVREAEALEVQLSRLEKDHVLHEPVKIEGFDEDNPLYDLPEDLARFYHKTDGAELFDKSFQIVPLRQIQKFQWGSFISRILHRDEVVFWHGIVRLADGSWFAINTDPNRPEVRQREPDDWTRDYPICHCSPQTVAKAGKNPVVAVSFTELLKKMLDSKGERFWEGKDFNSYGDADQFTWRG